MNILNNYRAYCEFIRADNSSPILNELGNIFTTLIIMVIGKFVGLAWLGVILAAGWFLAQRVEAHRTGAEWLRNGKDLKLTKQFVVGKVLAKYIK